MGTMRFKRMRNHWIWLLLPLLLTVAAGCRDSGDNANASAKANRVIAEIKTDYENGGIGLAAADFDHDGDIDLISIRHLDQGKIWLHRNDGTGQFDHGVEIGRIEPRYYGIGLAADDFDEDGDVDLALVKHVDGGKVFLLENKGDNLFY